MCWLLLLVLKTNVHTGLNWIRYCSVVNHCFLALHWIQRCCYTRAGVLNFVVPAGLTSLCVFEERTPPLSSFLQAKHTIGLRNSLPLSPFSCLNNTCCWFLLSWLLRICPREKFHRATWFWNPVWPGTLNNFPFPCLSLKTNLAPDMIRLPIQSSDLDVEER